MTLRNVPCVDHRWVVVRVLLAVSKFVLSKDMSGLPLEIRECIIDQHVRWNSTTRAQKL